MSELLLDRKGDPDWDESKHPRRKDGKFGSGAPDTSEAKKPLEFSTIGDAEWRQLSKRDKSHLSAEQRYTIRDFSDRTHVPINRLLRTGEGTDDDGVGWDPEFLGEEIARLDAAMEPMPQGTTLFRGMTAAGLPEGFLDNYAAEDMPGLTLDNPGYMSTTTSPMLANRGQVRLTIDAPVGTPHLIPGDLSMSEPEREVILGRDTKLIIVFARQDERGDLHLRVRAVPAGSQPPVPEPKRTRRDPAPPSPPPAPEPEPQPESPKAPPPPPAPTKTAAPRKSTAAVRKARDRITSVVDIGDDQASEAVTGELLRQADRTPNTASKLGRVSDVDRRVRPNSREVGSQNTLAYYRWDTNEMTVTGAGLRYTPQKHQAAQNSGWFSQTGHEHAGVEATVAHEYGHHVDNMLTAMHKMNIGFSIGTDPEREQAKADTAEWKAILAEDFGLEDAKPFIYNKGELPAHIRTKVSKYAASSMAEFHAEVWAEYSQNPNARPHIKRLGAWMEAATERYSKHTRAKKIAAALDPDHNGEGLVT